MSCEGCECERVWEQVSASAPTWPPCRTGWTSRLLPTARSCCWALSLLPQPLLSQSSSWCSAWAARGETAAPAQLHTHTRMHTWLHISTFTFCKKVASLHTWAQQVRAKHSNPHSGAKILHCSQSPDLKRGRREVLSAQGTAKILQWDVPRESYQDQNHNYHRGVR